MENKPNNPSRKRGGERLSHEALLLRDVLVPSFTETTELIQSTTKLLLPTQEEWLHRYKRTVAISDMLLEIINALGPARAPIDTDTLDGFHRTIIEEHQEIIASRETGLKQSSVLENATRIEGAVEAITETSLAYFRDHPDPLLPRPVVETGLRAQFAASNAMYGLEHYFRQNLTGERNEVAREGNLAVIGREFDSLKQVKNRSPLRFLARDIKSYQERVDALDNDMVFLDNNEDYKAIIEADKELRQVLQQLKSTRR